MLRAAGVPSYLHTGAASVRKPRSIIPFGDSITLGSTVNNAMGSEYQSGYSEATIYTSKYPISIIRNAGVAGNTTAQMLARIQTDVIDYAPDACLLLGGTNDLSSGMSDAAIAAMMDNLESMVIQLLSNNILPILVTPPPKNTAVTEAKKVQYLYYRLAGAYRLPLLDMYRVVVNTTNGQYKASYSADGTHLNSAGITAVAADFSTKFADLDNIVAPTYLAAVSETASGNLSNLIRNGSFAIAASPPTPDGWTVNATNATPSLVAATLPYTGNNYEYVKSDTAAVYMLWGNISSGFSANDILDFNGAVDISGLTPATANGFNVTVGRTGGSGAHSVMKSWRQNGAMNFSTRLTVTSGITALLIQVFVQDAATWKINNLTMINRTSYDAIWTPLI